MPYRLVLRFLVYCTLVWHMPRRESFKNGRFCDDSLGLGTRRKCSLRTQTHYPQRKVPVSKTVVFATIRGDEAPVGSVDGGHTAIHCKGI